MSALTAPSTLSAAPTSASAFNESLSREAAQALDSYRIKDTSKVVVRFKATGNAPIMKQNYYKITAGNRFQSVIAFLRKELAWKPSDAIHPIVEDGIDAEKPGASTCTSDYSVFDDPVLAKFYTPPDNYESAHRFDPTARWTKAEEDAVRRKCDWRICFFICICFAALQLDRGNISNALSDNMLHDLGLTTKDYNLGQTIFYVTFLFMELPSQLISKKVGVDRWVPFQMIAWSVVAACQCKLTGKKSFFATRALLGALEGGFIPDMILYLSYFYTSAELTFRLSLFWTSLTATGICATLAAAGILQMRGLHGWAGWQYLFLIEGLITLAVGIFAAFWMPASPTQTAGGLRGKGWFSEREEIIIVNRVLKDDPTKSSMHNREAIGPKALWKSLSDYDHWPIYALGLITYVAPGTVTAYYTLTLRSLGFNTFHTNLLTIPAQVLFIINNLGRDLLSLASTKPNTHPHRKDSPSFLEK
ncbi:ubiquitin-like protein ATG12, partial [Phenoliferia sp. Uapishka_3]